MLNFDCGIYAIISPTGERYIGQSQSLKKRWADHIRYLKAGKHNCENLQNAFNAGGELSLRFVKLAIVPIAQLSFREQEQIDQCPEELLLNKQRTVFEPRRGDSYGALARKASSRAKSGANNPNWKKSPSAAQREKLSTATKLAMQNPEYRKILSDTKMGSKNPNAKAVVCIETGTQFDSFNDAVRWLKENGKDQASNSSLVGNCKGRCKSAYGYTWRYADAI